MNEKIISNGILRAVGIMLLVFLGGYALLKLQSVLVYIVLAMIVSLMGHPLIKILKEKMRFSNVAAVITTISVIILILTGIVGMFIPLIITQGKNLSSIDFNNLGRSIEEYLTRILNHLGIENTISTGSFSKIISMEDFSDIVNGFMSFISDFGVGLFSVVFIAFFFMKDGKKMSHALIGLVSKKHIEQTQSSVEMIKDLLSRYFVGLLFQITIIFIILATDLLIFGVKDAIVIAFLCALFNLIPYLGPIIGAGIISVLTISSFMGADFYAVILPKTIYVLMGFLFAQLIDNFVSQPLIFSNSVKSTPLEIFLVILVGGAFFGTVGMVIAIPAYTVVKVILKAFFPENKLVQLLTKNI